MSCLTFDDVNDSLRFTPITSALSNLQNGAGTIAALIRLGAGTGDVCGLVNSAHGNWYHTLSAHTIRGRDDDGLVVIESTDTALLTAEVLSQAAGNYFIYALTWAAGTVIERFHVSSLMGAAESWQHDAATGNNGGNRAGPGTSGHFEIGNAFSEGFFGGDIALIGVWAGVGMSDGQIEALWVNKKTSDWYLHAAGTPTMLIELTTTTPVDIGANPSTFSVLSGPALTAPDPTGWTFDGVGTAAAAPGPTRTFSPIPFMKGPA